MFKKLHRRKLWIVFAATMLSGAYLHAKRLESTLDYVELATGFMRGPCSALEASLRGDHSASAHFKKILISAMRLTHDYLVIKNHPYDYPSWYPQSRMLSSGIHGTSHVIGLIEALFQDDDSGGTGGVTSKRISASKAFVTRVLLPALESMVALHLTLSDDRDIANQKLRFIAQALLSALPECQSLCNAGGSEERTMALVIILVDAIYALYQLQYQDSNFNAWLASRPMPVLAPAPIPPAGAPAPQPRPMSAAARQVHRERAMQAAHRRQQEEAARAQAEAVPVPGPVPAARYNARVEGDDLIMVHAAGEIRVHNQCQICLDRWDVGHQLGIGPCGHVGGCYQCIHEWRQENEHCINCGLHCNHDQIERVAVQ